MISHYILGANGVVAQFNAANVATLKQQNNGKAPTDLNNGSDNLLLDNFLRPALGCAPFLAPDMINPGTMIGSLALNEIQAAAMQATPVARVPPMDPMVVSTANGKPSLTKQNAYRAAVNQKAATAATSQTTYCKHYLAVGATSIASNFQFTNGFTTPDAANGKDLFTFLGQRFQASWAGMGCQALVPIKALNAGPKGANAQDPIVANRDGNGVTQTLTFNTAALAAAFKAAGGKNPAIGALKM
ncbi:hypothetical protein HDU76_001958 [Blyttiomyces sp. JEL0837]|nr:hypothetical protein HDU76_001958 [Blyttiomyces sp. JEL0837]